MWQPADKKFMRDKKRIWKLWLVSSLPLRKLWNKSSRVITQLSMSWLSLLEAKQREGRKTANGIILEEKGEFLLPVMSPTEYMKIAVLNLFCEARLPYQATFD